MNSNKLSLHELGLEIDCINNKILNQLGFKIDRQIGKLNQSFYIFNKNNYELKKELESFKNFDKASHLMKIENKELLDNYTDELLRLFHNFLASAKSLIEHARNIVKESECNKEFKKKYQLEIVKRFSNSECNKFIEDFRNYILHKGLPNIFFRESYKQMEGNSSLVLINIKYLKKWKGWTKLSESYINSLQENEDFSKIINQYSDAIFKFYEWFIKEFLNSHKNEYNELSKLQNQLIELKKLEMNILTNKYR